LRLLGKESVVVDPKLRVVKISARGLENCQPEEMHIRERTGCSMVAVERGEELLMEFSEGFRFHDADAIFICGSAQATQNYAERFSQPK
jgi:uncharacterized protein with PhoU and TrkA domain